VLDPSQIAPEAPRPITRKEYDRLVAEGFFEEDEHVELLYGVLVRMAPQDPPHASVVQKLIRALAPALLPRAEVRIQLPFAASGDSEPEPDVAIVPRGDYASAHPEEAFLIVEVANTSQGKDRNVKGRLYAECHVPEYWVIDVPRRTVEVYTQPNATGYASCELRSVGDGIVLVQFSDVTLSVAALF
jgi:Uma2 family endonuclease